MAWVTPLPIMSPVRSGRSGRFGVAIAFVLLLFLFALALSIVLKPRSHDMPQELSLLGSPALHADQPDREQLQLGPGVASGGPGDGRA